MLLEGMKSGIGLVLIFIGFFHLVRKEKIELGLICIIIGTGSFYGIYFEENHWDFTFSFFFADYRVVLVPSLAYIYFLKRANYQSDIFRKYFIHLSIPFLVLITYWILKFGFTNLFLEHIFLIVICFRSIWLIIVIFYFIEGVRFLNSIKTSLKPIAYRNFKFVYSLLLGHFIAVLFLVFADTIRTNLIIPEVRTIETDIIAAISFLSYIPILLFATIELTPLKKFFFNELFIKGNNSIRKHEINDFINESLLFEKPFLDEDFNLSAQLKINQISESDFRKYIKTEFGETLNEYINRLKVEHFKTLLNNPENDRYDLLGLAKMSGFNSKATFYRVFKQCEGITPNEYKDSLT